MVKKNIKDYKDALETRIKTFKELSKRGRWVRNFGLLLVLIDIAMLFILLNIIMATNIVMIIYVLLFITGSLIAFLGDHLIKSKGIPTIPSLYLSSDEKIFLKIFNALDFLEVHLNEGLEPAKYQCLKEMHEAQKLMEEYWVTSDIKVIMKEIGNEIETFKEKFEKNLIYTLENALEKETIQSAYNILTEFGEYFSDPTKEKLIDLNKKMDSLSHSEIIRPHYPIIDFLMRYQIHQHAAVMALIFAVGFFSASLGIYYGHISIDTAFVVFATIFGPLIAAYVAYVLRK